MVRSGDEKRKFDLKFIDCVDVGEVCRCESKFDGIQFFKGHYGLLGVAYSCDCEAI